MRLSIVIRTRDEADRLRLTLASLTRQNLPDHPGGIEVVVVNDGSSDHTAAVIAEASSTLNLTPVHHTHAQGRAAASNAGARAAGGDILLFLDGDTLAHPDMARHHLAAHAGQSNLIGRGEHFHLRCTRFFRDPETGTPMPGEEARVARLSAPERDRLRVTRAQVLDDFPSITQRAERGIYPGAGPRILQDIELAALRDDPDCPLLWAAACGANMSAPRAAFLDVGGFNPAIDCNEHREVALRLCGAGHRVGLVPGAYTYHQTHRSGWRDPLLDTGWEAVFYAAHPLPEVALLPVFWASIAPQSPLAVDERILSLPALAMAARTIGPARRAALRARLGLPTLAATTGPTP